MNGNEYVAVYDPDCPYCGGGGITDYEYIEGKDGKKDSYRPAKRSETSALSADEYYDKFGQESGSRCRECDTFIINANEIEAMITELRRLGVSDDIWKDNAKWRADNGKEEYGY